MNIKMMLEIKQRFNELEIEYNKRKTTYVKVLEEKLLSFGDKNFDSFVHDGKITSAKEELDTVNGRISELNKILEIISRNLE